MAVALITGASGGIGSAVSRMLCRDGWTVVLGYNSGGEKALALCGELSAEGLRAFAVKLDVTDEEDIIKAARFCEELGGLGLAVNCAGLACIRQIQDMTAEEMDLLWKVDLRGTALVCREAAKAMIRRGRGCIVNISSMWGVTGASCESIYSALKAGVIGLTKSLAKELGPSGIRVNCVAPGVIDTPMNASLSEEDLKALADETPLGRIGEPDDVARAVLYLAGADFVTGQCLTVDGGLTL